MHQRLFAPLSFIWPLNFYIKIPGSSPSRTISVEQEARIKALLFSLPTLTPSHHHHHGSTTESGPAALTPANGSHATTTRGRSSKTRHDAPRIPSPTTAADRRGRPQTRSHVRPIHRQTQTTSLRATSTPAANDRPAASRPARRPTRRPRPARPTSPHQPRRPRSESPSTRQMAARARPESPDLHPERPAKRHVQRYCLTPLPPHGPT